MDLNEDGNPDILSGSYSRMDQDMAGLFQVLWGKAPGEFEKAKVLNGTDGEPLIIPVKNEEEQVKNICTRPWAVDWDHDGDLDLLVGNFEGTFYLFEGEGKGEFSPKSEVVKTEDGDELRIEGAHSDPMMVDWDGDGDLDVLSGNSLGGVQWAENTAGPDEVPSLKPFQTILTGKGYQSMGELVKEAELDGPTNSSRVWATDYNGDGKLDLLVGDCVTLASPAGGLSEADCLKELQSWNEEMNGLGGYPVEGTEDEMLAYRKKLDVLYEARDKIVKEERTGYVWLFVRK